MNLFWNKLAIRWKIIIPYVSLVLLLTGGMVAWHIFFESSLAKRRQLKRMETQIGELANACSHPFAVREYTQINELLKHLKDNDPDIDYIALTNKKGKVIASTDSKRLNKMFVGLKGVPIKLTSETSVIFSGDSSSYEMLSKVDLFGIHMGNIWAGISTKSINETMARFNFIVITIGASIVILGTLIFSLIIKKMINRPIDELRDAAQRISTGALEERMPCVFQDELGDLALSFNEMTSRLSMSMAGLRNEIEERKNAEKSLEKYKNHLEELVRQRTDELASSNQKLKREAEEQEKLKNDIKQILDASSDAIRVIDKDYNIIYANAAWLKLKGIGKEENVIGKKCYDAAPGEKCNTAKCYLQQILETGRTIKEEALITDASGVESQYMVSHEAYTDANGIPTGMVKTYRNINEEKKAQKMLEENAIQQGRVEMSNNILHDVGNAVVGMGSPIVSLYDKSWKECSSLSKVGALLEDSEAEMRNAMGERKTKSLMNYIDSLNESLKARNAKTNECYKKLSDTLSHITSVLMLQRQYVKNGTAAEGALDIKRMLENALLMQSTSIEKRNIKLKVNVAGDIPDSIPGDKTRLMQLALNIIRNSCQAFDELKDERERIFEINLTLKKDKKHILIEFIDNASGIDPEILNRVFTRGYSSKMEGTGIGLSQCFSIVESHGGKIKIASEGVGSGCKVIVELPL